MLPSKQLRQPLRTTQERDGDDRGAMACVWALRFSCQCPFKTMSWPTTERDFSNTLIDQSGEEAGIDHELPPYRVERRCRLRRNGFIARSSLLLEPGDVVADPDEHIAKGLEFDFVADRLAMPGDDDRVLVHRRETSVACSDHPV